MSILRTGLNPYGLAYHLGLQGRGTPRANPRAAGLEGFLALAAELGSRTLELWDGWLAPLTDVELAALRRRLDRLEMLPVISSSLQRADIDACLRAAEGLGANLLRLSTTSILCGDRHAEGTGWPALVAAVRRGLDACARLAAARGVTIGIENHQDFTSLELVGFCEEFGPAVRIVYDTGNSFPVAEAPLDFTRVVAPYVAHVHLKDYRVQPTAEGFRLVRCAIGDGAVPFAELVAILAGHHDALPAVLEPGALDSRHVRLFKPGWWQGYAPVAAPALAACLKAASRHALPADADARTPWERGQDAETETYELDMIQRSAANMRALGLM